MPSPWDAYATELVKSQYGHPLWYPEPDESGELELGDVGYIENGRFYRLFNVLKQELNKRGAPEHFKPMELPDDHYHTNTITEEKIATSNIAKVHIGADMTMCVCYMLPISPAA